MNSLWSQVQANVRFAMWKARTYHTQRYVSLIVVVAIIFGAVFFSNGVGLFKPKTAHAALGATYAAGTLTIDGGGIYMLMQDATCGNAALWPLNQASAAAIKVNNVAYQGRICIAATDNVVVQTGGSTLSIVGTVTLAKLDVLNSAQVITAPSDANAKVTPYSSRPNWFATRFTGFLLVPANTDITVWPAQSDDSLVIEYGNAVQVPGVPVSLDTVGWTVATYNGTMGGGWCANFDPTFVGATDCAGGQLPAVKGVRKTFTNPGFVANYVPIRMSTWEVNGDARFQVGYKVGAGVDQTLPVSAVYAPCETDTVLCPIGSADLTTGQNKMRFEHATSSLGTSTTPALNVKRDLSNANEYAFFSRTDLTSGGTFSSGFGKQALGSTNNNNFDFFWWSNSDALNPGSPLSNAQRDDGLGYKLGAAPVSAAPSLLQNYKLQDHNDALTAATAINAGVQLTTTGDLTINGGQAGINAGAAGLPGGVQFYPGWSPDRGVSGVGGLGSASSPGVWIWHQNSGCDMSYAGHWNIHGGGGGGAGKCISPGPGGGGGGAMGYGAAGFATDTTGTIMSVNAAHTDTTTDRVKNYGAGGAGFGGVGGGSNGNTAIYYTNNTSSANIHDRNDGSSNRGSYTPASVTGMGGGGGQGSQGEDKNYVLSPAGAGGGAVVLVIGGNLILTNGFINASGESPVAVGEGAGGGGTIDITVKGTTFDLDVNSHIFASGGGTVHDPVPNNPDRNPATSYPEGGPGGGGLVKIRSNAFGPAAGSGWPTDYCNGIGQPFVGQLGPNQNLQAKAGSTQLLSGGNPASPAENGLIDIAYYAAGNPAGSPFCGVAPTASSSQDVQISKRIQQWSGTGAAGGVSPLTPNYDTSVNTILNDAYWSDSVTTVPSTFLRITVSVRNADSTNPRTIKVDDVLPAGVPVQVGSNGHNVCLRTTSAQPTTFSCTNGLTVNGNKVTMAAVPVPATAKVDVMYVAQVNNPF